MRGIESVIESNSAFKIRKHPATMCVAHTNLTRCQVEDPEAKIGCSVQARKYERRETLTSTAAKRSEHGYIVRRAALTARRTSGYVRSEVH